MSRSKKDSPQNRAFGNRTIAPRPRARASTPNCLLRCAPLTSAESDRTKPWRPSRRGRKDKGPDLFGSGPFKFPGSVLLSHTVSRAVPSAPRGLTAVFGMGTGGAPSIRPPETLFHRELPCRTERSAYFFCLFANVFDDSHLENFMAKPHGRLVPVSFAPRSASTPGLSTWSSP